MNQSNIFSCLKDTFLSIVVSSIIFPILIIIKINYGSDIHIVLPYSLFSFVLSLCLFLFLIKIKNLSLISLCNIATIIIWVFVPVSPSISSLLFGCACTCYISTIFITYKILTKSIFHNQCHSE